MPVLSVLLLAALAGAEPDAAAAIDRLMTCRTVTDPVTRLGCFDAAAKVLSARRPDLVVADRRQLKERERRQFGLPDRPPPRGPHSPPSDAVLEVSAPVRGARLDGEGRWVVELATGATWRQTDDAPLALAIRPNSVARVRHGALGSYVLQIDGRTSFKVRRLR